MTREELKAKKNNLETQKMNIIHQMLFWDDTYDGAVTAQEMLYAKKKAREVSDEYDSINAVIAVIDKQLRQGYIQDGDQQDQP